MSGTITFKELIKKTSDCEIIPLNLFEEKDLEVVNEIKESAKRLMKVAGKARRRYQADRVNEVGNRIENEFVEILSGTSLEAETLGKAGYPDIKLSDKHGRITYLESKTTSKPWDKGGMRSFYYSSGRKINSDARHLLIGWKVKEEEPKYWELKEWKISELTDLELNLKKEYNATNKELYDDNLILYESE